MRKQDITIEDRIVNFKSLINYFEHWMVEQPLFVPEYEISKEILAVILSTDKTDEEKLQLIPELYNKITRDEHYDGSGWFDFQIRLEEYFNHFGYNIIFDQEKGSMLVQKS